MGAKLSRTYYFFYSLWMIRPSSSIDLKAHCGGSVLSLLLEPDRIFGHSDLAAVTGGDHRCYNSAGINTDKLPSSR
jgi:hypothetical protein